jgi:hypothetical protein
MKFYICNAFSLSMLDRSQQAGRDSMDGVRVPKPIDEDALFAWLEKFGNGQVSWESAVGHADTARVFGQFLGLPIEVNRVSISLSDPDTHCLIGQYVGPRLPEGATELPEGARIEWWVI